MRRRALAAFLALVALGVSCAPRGAFERIGEALSPPAPAAVAPALDSAGAPQCSTAPVSFRFRFAPETTQEDRTLITRTMRLARDYFPLRYPRVARWSYAHDGYLCYPLRHSEPVTTTIEVPDDRRIAEYGYGGGGPLFFIRSPDWLIAPLGHRYAIAFHEAYHWFQHLAQSVREMVYLRPDPDLPFWLHEGSAEWAGFDAAVRFGFFPSMDAARAHHVRFMRVARDELKRYERRRAPAFDAYSTFFFAADHLASNHGGREALRRFWEIDAEDDQDWEETFVEAFGITPARFYREFAASG